MTESCIMVIIQINVISTILCCGISNQFSYIATILQDDNKIVVKETQV